jgi:hypothetical protein
MVEPVEREQLWVLPVLTPERKVPRLWLNCPLKLRKFLVTYRRLMCVWSTLNRHPHDGRTIRPAMGKARS